MRLIDVIELKKQIAYSNILEDGKSIDQIIDEQPTVEPRIIRCKNCKYWGYDDDDGEVRMCHAAKHNHVSSHWNIFVCRTYKGDFFCADAERRTITYRF